MENIGHRARVEDIGPSFIAWARQHWPERSDFIIRNWRAPDNGASSQVLLFDLDWQEEGRAHSLGLVLRLEAVGSVVFPRMSDGYATGMELEFLVQRALREHSSARVPPMVALERDERFLGRAFYLAEIVPGFVPPTFSTMASQVMKDLSPAQRRRMVLGGVEQLAAIHAMDWQKAGLAMLLPGASDAPDTHAHVQRFADDLVVRLNGRSLPVVERAMDWLLANVPADDRNSIIWGDCRLGNMIFETTGDPAAVLDWEGAAIAPSAADVGWWLHYDWRNHEYESTPRLPGVPDRSEQLDHYVALTGHRPGDLEYWATMAAIKTLMAVLTTANRMIANGLVTEEQCAFIKNNPHHHRLEKLFG
ncbi:phosphotransferase family protein [Sphingobium sp. V4]|uniref:phosphotransferase family protein n=1 Tax=Sphingobium sp. V4 TaxID=3038927 RepID=UPI0025582458|nr:phosphotransferase family protein [Sphingobium sp. V4]WIW89430.1 phosphotransferase family protein [Sphingobium sp. V4]